VRDVSLPWLQAAREEFSRRLRDGRMAHACLLAGPRGLGKSELARQMAASLLCLRGADTACGECRSCQLLESGAHPDFRLITFELNEKTDKMRTELVIGQVRELNSVMQLTHSLSPRKVALIDPAEAMNRHTANALLKTLEEPPGDGVILLVSHDPGRLPATIRSRCQLISVRLPDEQMAQQWLVEQSGVEPGLAADALRASAGSPLLARELLAGGAIDRYRDLNDLLNRVEADETAVGEALASCADADPERLWSWLSLIAAGRVRACLFPGASQKGAAVGRGPGQVREISRLQLLADRNRRELASALRKDLLLRDWLIQWARLQRS